MNSSNSLNASLSLVDLRTLGEVLQERARRNLLSFIHQTMPSYQAGWFHRMVCSQLDQFLADVKAKKSPRLMLFAPPRHGKSEIVSRRFPAYALGRDPDLTMIAASYGDDLASRLNRDVQRIIDNEDYRAIFPATTLNGSNVRTTAQGSYLRNNDIFEVVDHKGGYRSAGVGGGITGMGADILLIDDPIKDAEQANSPVYRQKVWEWFSSTAYTRLMPGGGVLIILTRWHEDDLAGRLIDAAESGLGERWNIVSYPAIAEQDEEHRKMGEALHPERYSVADLERIHKTVGSRVWGALYQQRPAPTEGNRFKREWWRFYRTDGMPEVQARPDGCTKAAALLLPETFDQVIDSWDLTFKGKENNDWVVGVKVGIKGSQKYVLRVWRKHVGFGGAKDGIVMLSRTQPRPLEVLVEDKANGPAVMEDLGKVLSALIPVEPKGGKEARAAVMEPQVEAGNWFLPDGAEWVSSFVDEFAVFPNGKHDDQVDACSQAAARLGEDEGTASLWLQAHSLSLRVR